MRSHFTVVVLGLLLVVSTASTDAAEGEPPARVDISRRRMELERAMRRFLLLVFPVVNRGEKPGGVARRLRGAARRHLSNHPCESGAHQIGRGGEGAVHVGRASAEDPG